MEIYEPGRVYENIVKMFGYRNVVLRGAQLTEDQLAQALNNYEYAIVIGEKTVNGATVECYVVIIAPGSKYSNKSQDFKKLTKYVPTKDVPIEVMFVSKSPLTVHVKKQLALYRSENPKYYVEDHDYEMFIIEKPRDVSVPKHVIATEKEVSAYCERHFTTKDKLPRINPMDPQAVWIGLKLGMVAKIYRLSETAGEAIVYRYCSIK